MASNEYDIVQGNIKRRRGLVDALTQQSLTPDQGGMVGQVYVGPGLLQALAKPLQALAGSYAGANLDKEEAANSQARQSALVDALAGMQSQPGSAGFTNEALGSQFPELQAAGMKSLDAQLTPGTKEKWGTSPQQMKDPSTGRLVDVLVSNQGNIRPVQGYESYEKPNFVRGEAVIPSQAVPGQLYGEGPKGTQVTIQNTQEGARDKQLGQEEAKQIVAAREMRSAAQRTFNMATKLEEIDKNGVLSGPTAAPAVYAARLAEGLGVQLSPEVQAKIANTEQFDVVSGKEISDMVLNSSAGRGFTDTDREFVAKTFPTLMQTPEGRKKAITYLKDFSLRSAKQGKQIEDAIRSGGMQNLDLTNGAMDQYEQGKQPAQPTAAPGGIKFLGFE